MESTEQKDILNMSQNVDETLKVKSGELFTRHDIQGTPFYAIEIKDKWFLALGRYKISEDFSCMEDIETYLKTNMYEVVLDMITRVWDMSLEMKMMEKPIKKPKKVTNKS
ncbi:MAG: hypothetical protein [Microviridae sp.]|nr:MAG: hypothetical protein [Microviridae sp.]